ncbi:MAG: response regulator transcription factor [Proteobacteria bacterium]|nr:response regulator transcription factor [Pseudomonadota bacterium]
MQILVVEDDKRVSQFLEQALKAENYQVNLCRNLEELDTFCLQRNQEAPRVVILDRMLGNQDGASRISLIKKTFPQIKILVLSAIDQASEKARVLDMGADDYLAKPFSLEELSARLRLLLRRNVPSDESRDLYILSNLHLDLKRQQTSVNSKKIDLTKKEFQILSLFLESPGRIFNRFQLLDRVWDMDHLAETNVVEVTIKNLRRKLEEAGSLAVIQSKRQLGYWIEE